LLGQVPEAGTRGLNVLAWRLGTVTLLMTPCDVGLSCGITAQMRAIVIVI